MKNCDLPNQIPGRCRQFMAALIVNLSSLLSGISFGWASPMIPILRSDETPVGSRPLTENEASWLVSIMAIGPLLILPFCGSFCEYFGRRITGLIVAIPFLLCWILIGFATNFYFILVGQFFNGIGAALTLFFVNMYIKEIASDNVRGQLGSLQLFTVKIGIVLVYTLGTVMSFTGFAIFAGIIPIIHFGGLLFLPETPIYLVRKNRIDSARRSLMWLRGNNQSVVDSELSRLRTFVGETMTNTKSATFKDLFRNRGTIKGLIIGVVLAFGQQMSGISVILTYTVTIFNLAKSSVDPNLATVIVGVMQLLGAWMSTLLIERTGRRLLLMLSSFGMILCHFTLGIFLLIQSAEYNVSMFTWIPIVTLSIFGLSYTIGMGSVVGIISNEFFCPDVASICNSISVIVLALTSFLITKFFSSVADVIGLHNCFFFFALSCMGTFAYVFFAVPETRGKTIECIFKELNSTNGQARKKDEEHK